MSAFEALLISFEMNDRGARVGHLRSAHASFCNLHEAKYDYFACSECQTTA